MAVTKGPRIAKAEKKQKGKKDDEKTDTAGAERECGGASGGRKSRGEESDTCVDCGQSVQTSQMGLKCDYCGFWHHATCELISEEVYYFLQEHSKEQSLLWVCRKCLATSKNLLEVRSTMQDWKTKWKS